MKILFIYRDPRDQVVSLAHFMRHHFNTWVASKLPLNEIISRLIVDYSTIYYTEGKDSWNDPVLKTIGGVANFYNLYLPWFEYPDIYITTFEKLVGTKGGGSDEIQFQEIVNIANFLELELTPDILKEIQINLFGQSTTFREGCIGGWQKHFTQHDKETLKETAGQLLIDLGYEPDLNW